MVGFWPVAVVPVGRVAAASMLWRAKGRLHVTVVVKARFQLEHNQLMSPMLPDPVRPQHGELAPYLGQADVVISAAHAHGPPGPGGSRAVRLALFREWAVIDKSLLVYPKPGEPGPAPLVTAGEPAALIIQPSQPQRAASFGPVPWSSPIRAELLGDDPAPQPAAGVLEIPDMFPWAYYQVAPPDQRTSYLRGDEWVVLDGMHEREPRLQSRLPGAHAMVRVYPPGLSSGACYQVAMQADQLSIDVHRSTCSLLWRGSFPVADVASARSLTLVAAAALRGQPPAWPNAEQLAQSAVVQARFQGAGEAPRVGPTLAQAPADAYADTDEKRVPPAIKPQPRYDQAALDARAAEIAARFEDVDVHDGTTFLFPEPPSSAAPHAALALTDDGVLSLSILEEPHSNSVGRAKTDPLVDATHSDAAKTVPKLAQVDISRLLRPVALSPAEEDARRVAQQAARQALEQVPVASVMRDAGDGPELPEADVDELEQTLGQSLNELSDDIDSAQLAALRERFGRGKK